MFTWIGFFLFFCRDRHWMVSHPADCGDRGTVFVVAPSVLGDIIREFDPSVDDRPERQSTVSVSSMRHKLWRHSKN
jgi:hypothetical protein